MPEFSSCICTNMQAPAFLPHLHLAGVVSHGQHVPQQTWCAEHWESRGSSGKALGWCPSHAGMRGSLVAAPLEEGPPAVHPFSEAVSVSLNCSLVELPLSSEWTTIILAWPGHYFCVYLRLSVMCVFSTIHSFSLTLFRMYSLSTHLESLSGGQGNALKLCCHLRCF